MSKLNKAISAFVSAAMLMSSVTPVMATGQRQVVVGHEAVIPVDDIKANIDSTSERILFASEVEENKMSSENVDINENPAKKLLGLADKNHKSMEDILQDAKQDPDGKTKLQIEVTMEDLEKYLKENNQALLDKINQENEKNKNNNSAIQNEQTKKLYEAAKEGNDFINKMLGYNNLEDFFAAVRKGDLNDYKDEILNLINVLFNGDRDAIAAAFGEDFAAALYGEKSEEQKEAEENQKEFKYDSAISSINSALESNLSISSLLEPLDSSEYKNDKLVLISYDSGLAKNSNTIGYKCAVCGNYYSFGLVCSCGKILNGENLSHAKNHGNISFTGSDGKKYELTLTKAMTAKASFAHPDEMPTTDTTVSVVSSTNLTNHELSRMGYSITSDTDQDDELTGSYSAIGSIVCKKCGKKPTLANFSQWVVNTETTGASDMIDGSEHLKATETDSKSNTVENKDAIIKIYEIKKKIREYDNLINSEKDEDIKKKYQYEMTKLENEISDIQKKNNITYQTAAEKYQKKINDKLQSIADDINNDKVSVDTLSNIKKTFYMYMSKDIIENYNDAKVDDEYYKRAQEKLEKMVKNNEDEKKKKEQEIRNDKNLSEEEKNAKILELGKVTNKDIQDFQKVIQYSNDPLSVDADDKINQAHYSKIQVDKYMEAYNEFMDKIKEEKKQNKELTAVKLGEFKVATFKDKITKNFYEGLYGALKAIGSGIDNFNNNSNPFSSKVFYCPDCYLNASPEEKMEAATAVDGKGNYGQLIIPSKIKNLDTDDTDNGYSDKDRQDVINQIIKILQELLDSIKEGKEDKGLKEAMGEDAYLALVKNMIDANQELADRNSAEAEQKRDEKYNENHEKLEDLKNNDIQQVFEAAKAGTKEAYENLNWMQKTLYEDFKKKFGFTNWQDPEDVVQTPDQKAFEDVMKDMFDKSILSGSNSEILSKMADYVNHTSINDNEYATVTLDISNMTASVKSNPATIVDDGVVGIYNDNSQSVFVLNPWSLSSGIDWTWTPTSLGQFVMKRSVSVYDTTENIITYNMNLSAYLDGYENIGVSNCLLQNVSTEYKKYDYSGENSSNVRNVTLDDIVYTVIQGDMTNYDSGKDATERIE